MTSGNGRNVFYGSVHSVSFSGGSKGGRCVCVAQIFHLQSSSQLCKSDAEITKEMRISTKLKEIIYSF